MKKITLLFTTIFLIGACSQNEQEAESPAEVTKPSEPLVEYVWHTAGPDFDEKGINLAKLINDWNSMIDDMSCSGMTGANILTPKVSNEGYDFIWVMLWDSQEGRDECWDDWTENQQLNWDYLIEGIMQYDLDNVYLFKPTIGKEPNMENTSGSFVNTFYFCTYNEGYSEDDLIAYQKDLNTIEGFSDYWWYVTLEPMFEQDEPKPDFVWLDLWGSNEDKASDQAIFANTDLPAQVDEKFSCMPNIDGVSFDGVAIRR
tara:strand:- start:49 stop:822 length:774 start_codon:yes stop_codon:yes gene_type:complete